MNQISSDLIYEGLLGYGMFSEKLPPFLSSHDFYKLCSTKRNQFSSHPRGYIHYDTIRNNGIPRAMGIPTPMSYNNLCMSIKNNWKELQNIFYKNTMNESHKVSRIHIRSIKTSKKIFEMNYKNFKIDGTPDLDLLIGKKYIVSADISSCFPSIYTHSISWALIGKKEAKIEKTNYKKWYNKMDKATQDTTNGETHGVLIGPHTSNLLSEVILTSIDKNLTPKYDYVRNIDDYTCYVSSHAEANLFLLDLASELRGYGLLLNHKKTKIIELPLASKNDWVRELSAAIPSSEPVKFNEVRDFIDKAVEVMRNNNNNAAILNYAIKTLSKKNLTSNARICFIKTYFHLILIYPYLITLLEDYLIGPLTITSGEMVDFINKLYTQEVKVQNYEAVCFSLYFGIKYNIIINDYKFVDAKESGNCIFLLLAFLYTQSRKEPVIDFIDLAKDLITTEHDFYENWLFVYEVLSAKDFSGSWNNKYWGEWKELKNAKITFISW